MAPIHTPTNRLPCSHLHSIETDRSAISCPKDHLFGQSLDVHFVSPCLQCITSIAAPTIEKRSLITILLSQQVKGLFKYFKSAFIAMTRSGTQEVIWKLLSMWQEQIPYIPFPFPTPWPQCSENTATDPLSHPWVLRYSVIWQERQGHD